MISKGKYIRNSGQIFIALIFIAFIVSCSEKKEKPVKLPIGQEADIKIIDFVETIEDLILPAISSTNSSVILVRLLINYRNITQEIFDIFNESSYSKKKEFKNIDKKIKKFIEETSIELEEKLLEEMPEKNTPAQKKKKEIANREIVKKRLKSF